jgi:hypothetical protein
MRTRYGTVMVVADSLSTITGQGTRIMKTVVPAVRVDAAYCTESRPIQDRQI